MEISEQLKNIRKEKGLTQQEFAVLLEVSTPTIASVENGSRDIPKALMKALVKKIGINANWLLTGEGEMFQKSASELMECNGEANYKIPILNQKVSCGPGQNWESEQNVVEYFDIRAISPKLNAKDVYGFRVSGTSMLGAGIRDGDVVLFSTKEERLKDGIYVFGLDGDAYCKRLEFDSIANRIKIYSVRVADLEKAELIKTLNSTDEGFAERFMLFGRVFSWIHLVDGEE